MSKASFLLTHVIRTMAGAYRGDRREDAELLSRYVENHDETAFATLMVRHGPMVWGICSRILGNNQDVEDVYQTVFMTLAAKGGKVRIKAVAGWLHQVARRAALNTQKLERSQKRLQESKKFTTGTSAVEEESRDEIHQVLHEEIGKLPDKQREVMVLHYLESKTQAEIAEILGVGESAVWDRLTRGRTRLHTRLAQRGLCIGVGVVGAVLAGWNSSKAIPPGLIVKTLQTIAAFRNERLTDGVARLAKEVLRHTPAATPWWKTGWTMIILCISGVVVGAGGVAWMAKNFSVGAGGAADVSRQDSPRDAKERVDALQPRLDLYGDPLPPGALARLGTVRFRLSEGSNIGPRVVMTQDKKLFIPGAMALDSKNQPFRYPIHCYDLITGKAVTNLKDARGQAVQLDPDAMVSGDGRLLAQKRRPDEHYHFWDLVTGNPLKIPPQTASPKEIAISPTSAMVAVAASIPPPPNKGGAAFELSIYDDTAVVRWRKTYEGPSPVQCMYSPNGKILMALCDSEPRDLAKAPNPPGGPQPRQPKRHEMIVARWDATTGDQLPSWTVPMSARTSYAWSNDGDTLAATPEQEQNVVCIWNTTAGKVLRRIHFDGPVDMASAALSSDGRMFAASAPEVPPGPPRKHFVGIWHTNSEKLHRKWDSIPQGSMMTFSNDGKWLVTVPSNGCFIQVWDVDSKKMVNQAWGDRGHTIAVRSLAYSPQADAWVSASHDELIRWAADFGADAYSVRRRLHSSDKPWLRQIPRVAISPHGQLVACADYVQGSLWGETARSLPINLIVPMALKISSDNKIVALYGAKHADGQNPGSVKVYLFNISTGECFHEHDTYFQVEEEFSSGLAFSPDGRWLAAAGSAKKNDSLKNGFHLLDLATGKIVAKKSTGRVFDIIFSQDGRTLAVVGESDSGFDTVSLWRVRADGGTVRIEGGRNGVTAPEETAFGPLSLSPDGRTIAGTLRSTSKDQAAKADPVIYVWETITGRERCRFTGTGSCLAFASDSRRLASGHGDGTILIWDATGRLDAGKLRGISLSGQAIESLWTDLAGANAFRAGRAVWTLAAAGESAASFIEKRLPVKDMKPGRKILSRLVADLENDAFPVREKASLELKKWGRYAEVSLRKVLDGNPSADLRKRGQEILNTIEAEPFTGEEIRALRALEVLGQIDSDKARQVLEKLSSGDGLDLFTPETRAALDFWKRMHQMRHREIQKGS